MYGLRFREELPEVVSRELDQLVAALRGFLLEEHNEDGTHITRDRELDFVPVGFIGPYGGSTAPTGWLLCDGSQVSRVTYKALFNVIGTAYGAGDGTLTFNLPDSRGRFPLGKAAAGTGSVLGGTGGALDHTHSISSHSHSISSDGSHSHGGSTGSNGGHSHGVSGVNVSVENGFTTDVTGAGGGTRTDTHTHSLSGSTDNTSDHAHSISSDGSHSHGGSTGSASGTTGTGNPAYQVFNYLIFAGR